MKAASVVELEQEQSHLKGLFQQFQHHKPPSAQRDRNRHLLNYLEVCPEVYQCARIAQKRGGFF